MNDSKGTAPTQKEHQAPLQQGWFDRTFQLTERGTTVGQELRGGLVTFFSMVYILVLNPLILSGPDSTGQFLGGGAEPNIPAIAAGTALVAGLMTILMGAVANFPLALAAGLGLNSIVAYTIVQLPGMTWADGMGIIVIEGIVILLLVVTGLREAIFRAVPKVLRTAISVGIGLFIALVGLVNAGIVSAGEGTPLVFGVNGSISTWPLVVFIFGLFLAIALMVRGVQGAILWSIIASTILAIIIEAVGKVGGWGLTEPKLTGSPVNVPEFSTLGEFSITGPFQKLGIIAVVVLSFSVMLADFFDTMGTMVAVAAEGDLLDEDGNPPRTKAILMIDSVGAIAGGMGGVSSNTSFVESATGVGEGGRTGLSAIFTGILFLLSTFLAPLFALVPSQAAAPALVVVGFMMMQQVVDIDWQDLAVAIPSFITIIFMPFGYSITVGIGVGFIVYVFMQTVVGRASKVHPLMWLTSALFVVYFLLEPITNALGVA
ncbi:AGZA family xanthine/uracil permease-like MFS transporter [Trueperella bonasi]|uniref:AGZA family xanthine/uracil permease-like MFS transporter n=1 Tax=Trueperella bonasi TaxID=312286 RepID=A0ABT9NFL0_9ACTO|nr:NCS2 family permease [Trueperella bonasi]MDP9806180.1 AGZA family xanthine/uracil permease-like MFS transporter [Trueperella bonasi]